MGELCKWWDYCQPENAASCCKNSGIWNDKRKKNYGSYCKWYEKLEALLKQSQEDARTKPMLTHEEVFGHKLE